MSIWKASSSNEYPLLPTTSVLWSKLPYLWCGTSKSLALYCWRRPSFLKAVRDRICFRNKVFSHHIEKLFTYLFEKVFEWMIVQTAEFQQISKFVTRLEVSDIAGIEDRTVVFGCHKFLFTFGIVHNQSVNFPCAATCHINNVTWFNQTPTIDRI